MMEGIGFYCGIVMRWFRDAFCELESARGASATGVDVYELLERKAATRPPGSNGVFGIFSNVMQANRWVHASPGFVGFDVGNPASAGRIECFRAIEESAAYVSRGHLEIVEAVTGMTVDGGGAQPAAPRRATLWPQIVADTLGPSGARSPRSRSRPRSARRSTPGVGAGLFDDAAEIGAADRPRSSAPSSRDPMRVRGLRPPLRPLARALPALARDLRGRPRAPAVARRRHLTHEQRNERNDRCPKPTTRDDKNFHEDVPAPDHGFFLKGSAPTTGA